MLLKKFFYQIFFVLWIACTMGLNEAHAQGFMSASGSYTQVPCDHDGVATVTVTGGVPPYNYYWNFHSVVIPGVNITSNSATNTLSNLCGRNVDVTVTDASGQFAIASINSAYPFEFTPTVVNATCPNANGSISGAVTLGGTAPFTYSWYDSGSLVSVGNNSSLTNLSPGGQYDFKVVDANGCSLWASEIDSVSYFTVTSINNIVANVATTSANCVNGTATSNTTGGTAPYSYIWTDYASNAVLPSTTNFAQNLVANHSYTVKVIDVNGCFKSQYFYVGTSLNFSAVEQATAEHCNDGDGTVMAIPQGNATAPYTYSWNTTPPQITQTATGLHGGYYQCYIVSANGCEFSVNSFIPIVSPVNGTYTATGSDNCNNPNGTATLNVTGGTAPYTYSWANGQNTQTATGLAAGQNHFLVTDAAGCSKNGSVLIPQINLMVATVSVTATTSCTNPNGQASINVVGGTSPYTYSWANGQTGQTATGLNVGNYWYWVTDATGCTTNSYNHAAVNYAGNLQVNVSTTPDMCSSGNGSATANVSGGLSPFSYSWANVVQTTSSITSLNQGAYYVNVTDANGCTDCNYGYVNYGTPLTYTKTVTNASCQYVSDGSITLNVTGGATPYTYQISGGGSQSSPTFTGLSPYPYYYFTITDANGCHINTNSIYVGYGNSSNCISTISGVVYDDVNQNCVQDAGEAGIPDVPVHCSNFGYVWTNNAGYYSFAVPVGTYNVAHYPTMYHKAKCPVSGIQSVNVSSVGAVFSANFADSTTIVQDLRVSQYFYPQPTPGFAFYQSITYENVGTTPVANAEPRHVYDNELSITSVTPTPTGTIYTPEEQIFGTMTLQPNTSFDVQAAYNVATNVPLGTVLMYQDSIFPITGDVTFWDNDAFQQPVVIGAYDPNYKEVFPKGEGVEGNITVNDSILEYVLHFQNTGTAPAYNVTLIDTLDTDLELSSVDMGYSTHNYEAKISENRVLEIYFPNIMLPDSGADMAGSNGLVAFRIKQKKNLQMGTQFTNQVGIIFDFNYPIYTNTTLNTLYEPTSIEKPVIETLGLFPNPAQNVLNIEIPSDLMGQDLRFECLDLTGKVVMSKENMQAGKTEISVAELPQGWYFARVIGKNTLLNGKFVIVR